MSDLDGRCFVRRGNTLIPADFAADELVSKIPEGKEIMVTIRKPRSPQHHRWFFALLRIVVENTDIWKNEEELLEALKIDVGHTKQIVTLDGEVVFQPDSINFASMDEVKFNEFRKSSCDALAQKILHCHPDELMKEVDATQRKAS